jgi:hypothetical protein
MAFLEALYVETMDEGRITRFEPHSIPFYIFNTNLGGALLLPTLVFGPDSDTDWALTHSLMIRSIAISQIVTSLEVYYSEVFNILANNIKTSQVLPQKLATFIKKTRISNEYLQSITENECMEFPISSFVPKFFPLQEKERIKNALTLFEIDPTKKEPEWRRTFGSDENSTVSLRHNYIHGGIDYSNLPTINASTDVKPRIKDAIVLVYCIERQLLNLEITRNITDLYPRATTTP